MLVFELILGIICISLAIFGIISALIGYKEKYLDMVIGGIVLFILMMLAVFFYFFQEEFTAFMMMEI